MKAWWDPIHIVLYWISICNSTYKTRNTLVSSWVISWWTPGRGSSIFLWFSLNARKLLEAHKKETAQIISLIDISLRVPFHKAGLCGQNMLLRYECSKTNRDFQVRVVWSVVEPSGIMMYFIKLDYNFRIHSSTACATISNFRHTCECSKYSIRKDRTESNTLPELKENCIKS